MPYHPPLKILTPGGPPRAFKYLKMGVRSIVWGIFCMYIFYIIFRNFCNFFQNSRTPGDPWGGSRGPGGAPPRGYPT